MNVTSFISGNTRALIPLHFIRTYWRQVNASYSHLKVFVLQLSDQPTNHHFKPIPQDRTVINPSKRIAANDSEDSEAEDPLADDLVFPLLWTLRSNRTATSEPQ